MQLTVYRAAVVVGVMQLAAIASGAFISSGKIALEPGQAAPSSTVHIILSIAALAVGFAFCVWVSVARTSRPLRIAAWLAFASLGLSGLITSPGEWVWHACFAHLSIALIAATMAFSSPAAEPVSAGAMVYLRPAAIATPPVVLAQIILGALYRHKIFGIMPHMLGAMVVALLTLIVSVVLLQNFGQRRDLRIPATALISLLLAQVCLGIAVFLLLLLGAGNTGGFVWSATGHVCVGTLTFAASVVLAMRVRAGLAA
ncbi:MAG TPA: hypothetical protein VKU01_13315 [Bryobacteraceae bacterium]|nr:hypothetical protein [Bryobacteraceae bacterium]